MKEVFVFGAGASKASSDTPLGTQLVWTYCEQTCLAVPIINGMPDTSSEDKKYANLLKFLKFVGDYYPELKDEVHRFLNRGMKIFFAPYILEKKHFVDDLLRVLQEHEDFEHTELVRQLIFEHLAQPRFFKANKLYKKFVATILNRKSNEDISVISFNFDCLLHEDFRNNVYFDYLIDFDWIDPNRNKIYKKQSPISLIKLNGSLDWGLCTHCNKLYLYNYFLNKNFYNDKICSCCNNGAVHPFVVMPYQSYHEKYFALWDKAQDCLRQANKVTIIGYSFPEYDTKVIELFKHSLNKSVQLEVIDYCDSENDIKNKYERLFPDIRNEIKVSLLGFQGYMEAADIV